MDFTFGCRNSFVQWPENAKQICLRTVSHATCCIQFHCEMLDLILDLQDGIKLFDMIPLGIIDLLLSKTCFDFFFGFFPLLTFFGYVFILSTNENSLLHILARGLIF